MVNLTIRLSKGAAGTSSISAAPKQGSPVPTGPSISPACPNHLNIHDLPVARGIGIPTSTAVVNILGRKVQRKLGNKVHFCVRCNFPIAIYGRLDPCEHAFCLTCAKRDTSCYLCDEKISRIQKLEVLEGIFICGAPRCLLSFLKKSDFDLHVKETHRSLLESAIEMEEQQRETAKHYAEFSPPFRSSPSSSAQSQFRYSSQSQQPLAQSSEEKYLRSQSNRSLTPPANFQREDRQSRQQQYKQHSRQQQQQQPHPQDQYQHGQSKHSVPEHDQLNHGSSQRQLGHSDKHRPQQDRQQLQHQQQQQSLNEQLHHQQQQLPPPPPPLPQQSQQQQQQLQSLQQQAGQQFPPSQQQLPAGQQDQNVQQQQHHEKSFQHHRQRQAVPTSSNQSTLPYPPQPYPQHSQPPDSPLPQLQHASRYDSQRFGQPPDQRMAAMPEYQDNGRPRLTSHPVMHHDGNIHMNNQHGHASNYHGDFVQRAGMVGPQQAVGMMDRQHFQDISPVHGLPPAPKRSKYVQGIPEHGLAWGNNNPRFPPGPPQLSPNSGPGSGFGSW